MCDQRTKSQHGGICNTWTWVTVVILIVMVLVGCSTTRELPQVDIVFQIHPADPDGMGDLGFVNADGTGYVRMSDAMPLGMLPVWSPDSTRIAYRRSNPLYDFCYYGPVALVGQRGVCSYLGGNGRVRWMPDGSAVLTVIAEQLELRKYRYAVVSIDPQQCEMVDELYVTLSGAAAPDLSPSEMLAFGRGNSITVVDLDTQEEWVVGEGVVPSWSPDGEWLAYTGADGIYIVRKDGTESQQVLEYCAHCQVTPSDIRWNKWPPLPEWSPDGKWLVYHREEQGEYAIYKLNLETCEEVMIIEGGLNPDWRTSSVGTPED